MTFFKSALLATALAVAGVSVAATSLAGETYAVGVTDFTAAPPSADQLIDALAPPPPPPRAKGMGNMQAVGASDGVGAPNGASKDLAVVERRVRLDIPFDNKSAELTPAARRILSDLATALTSPRLANAKIKLEGHASRTGDAAYNRDLTDRRAAAAARFLYDRGVTAARLSAVGYGFDRPIPGTDPRDGRNRRVEIAAVP